MRRYFQVGVCLLGIWMLWLLYAFTTFVEMEILLAYLGAMIGAGFFAVYFFIGWLLYRSNNRSRLARVLLTILGALVLAAAGRYLYLVYDSSYPGRSIDFSTAQVLQEGTYRFAPGEQKHFTIKAARDGVLKLEFRFATEDDLYAFDHSLFNSSGKTIGFHSRGTHKTFIEQDMQAGETLYLQVQNVDALNERSIDIRNNRP